jgi:hypothetical protein
MSASLYNENFVIDIYIVLISFGPKGRGKGRLALVTSTL